MRFYELSQEQKVDIVVRRFLGQSAKEIGKVYNVSEQTIYTWLKSDWCKKIKQSFVDVIVAAKEVVANSQ